MVFVLVCLNHSGCHSVLISNLSHLHLGQEIGIGSLCVFIFWQWTNIDVEGIGNHCMKKLLQLQPPWNQHCRWFWKFSYALERGNGTSHIAFTQISLKPYCAIWLDTTLKWFRKRKVHILFFGKKLRRPLVDAARVVSFKLRYRLILGFHSYLAKLTTPGSSLSKDLKDYSNS